LAVLRYGDLAPLGHWAGKFGLSVEHGDLVLAHQMRDAVRQLLGYGARAGDEFFRVVSDFLRRKAELVEIVQQVVDLRGAQQRLGRDAAPIEADAAQLVTLD